MPDLFEIYRTQPEKYDLLVSREDWKGNLLPAIESAAGLRGADVVEFGAGTGRVTRLLAPRVASIHAFDASASMLDVAARTLRAAGLSNWHVAVGDHRSVSAETASADIAVAGWTISAVAVTEQDWQTEVRGALQEMRRVARPGGCVIVIETLGTGWESPNPPDALHAYLSFLGAQGFHQEAIRTDYRFCGMEEARDLTEFFFGPDPLDALVETEEGVVLPECTGVWWALKDPAA